MPNVSIYVSDQDAPIFDAAKDRAKELGIPLSGLLARAVKEHLEVPLGFERVTLRIGEHLTESGSGTYRTIRFEGKLLAEQRRSPHDLADYTDTYSEFAIYLTRKGNFVVVRERREAEAVGTQIFEERFRVFDVVRNEASLREMSHSDLGGTPGVDPLPVTLVQLAIEARDAIDHGDLEL